MSNLKDGVLFQQCLVPDNSAESARIIQVIAHEEILSLIVLVGGWLML